MAFQHEPDSPQRASVPAPGAWMPTSPPHGSQGAQRQLMPPLPPLPPPGFMPACAAHPAFGPHPAYPHPFPVPFVPPVLPMGHPQLPPWPPPSHQPSGNTLYPGLGASALGPADEPVPSLPTDPFGVEAAGGCRINCVFKVYPLVQLAKLLLRAQPSVAIHLCRDATPAACSA